MASNDIETSETLVGGVNKEQPVWQQSSARNPGRIIPRWLTLWIVGIRSRLNPPAPWVVLLGLDGSGKSSVLEELEKILSPPLFTGVQVIYRHPGFLYARWLQNYQRRNRSSSEQTTIDHYAKPPHGIIRSIAKLGILALDWFVGYWGQMVHQQAKGHLILFDRHFFLDVSIDPLRYRYGGPLWFARLAGQLLPGPDLIILLDAPIEVLQNRKQEIPPEEAARQRSAYLELIQKLPNSYVIDASKPLEQVINEVEQIILRYTNS